MVLSLCVRIGSTLLTVKQGSLRNNLRFILLSETTKTRAVQATDGPAIHAHQARRRAALCPDIRWLCCLPRAAVGFERNCAAAGALVVPRRRTRPVLRPWSHGHMVTWSLPRCFGVKLDVRARTLTLAALNQSSRVESSDLPPFSCRQIGLAPPRHGLDRNQRRGPQTAYDHLFLIHISAR